MLPSFAGLDLRRRTAPTGAVLGQRALERRITHFREVFAHRVAGAPLSAPEHDLLDSELISIQTTLVARGPAGILARLEAVSHPPRDGGVDTHLDDNSQDEWVEQEQALHVLREIMDVFYSIAHSSEMRSRILNVFRQFVRGTSKPSDWNGGAQVQATLPQLFSRWRQLPAGGGAGERELWNLVHGLEDMTERKNVLLLSAMLPRLFSHWRQLPADGPLQWELWNLVHELAVITELKNVLLLSDDCYHMLRWHNVDKQEEVYGLLQHVLKKPVTFEMWQRFTERDGPSKNFWAETIIEDITNYVHEGRIDQIPDYKLATVAQMMQEEDFFFKPCVVRVSESTMMELCQPYIYKLYKGERGERGSEDEDGPWLDALKALASNGRLWETISKAIEKEEEDEEWELVVPQGSWELVVEALHDDDVLAKAACSDPWPSSVAALVLLHKLNEAHAELLSSRPLSKKDRARLKIRQKLYDPVLDAILKTHALGRYWNGAFVAKAVAFARQLLAFPSLKNPQQDALREEFESHKRPRVDTANPSTSTGASASSGAAFVSLLAFLSP